MTPHDKRHLVELIKKLLAELPHNRMPTDRVPIRADEPLPNSERKADEGADRAYNSVPPVFGPPSAQIPPDRYKVTCKVEEELWDKYKPFVEIAGLVILAVYTLYTIKMYCANRQAANAAESAARTAASTLDVFKIEQRPYLVLDTLSWAYPPGTAGKRTTVNVYMKNIGKTPATKMINNLKLLRFRPLSPSDATSPEQFVRFLETAFDALRKKVYGDNGRYAALVRHDIAPNDRFFSSAEDSGWNDSYEPLTERERMDFKKSHLVFFLIGVAKYTDTTDKPAYETQFCQWYESDSAATMGHICDSHNIIQ